MTLLDYLSPRVTVKRTANKDGGEYHCSCLKCGGVDRFMFWAQAGNFFCRQCSWRGDLITILREIDGLSFPDAAKLAGKDLPESDRDRLARERAVKEALLATYWLWYHRTLVEQCDLYRDCSAELEVAEIAYRATERVPELYSEEERAYWSQLLADLYDLLPVVETNCDILAYERHRHERLAWWERERTG